MSFISRYLFFAIIGLFISSALFSFDSDVPWENKSYYPKWEKLKPKKGQRHIYQKNLSPEKNGEALKKAIQSLKAGDRLVVDPGKYEVNSYFDITATGTAERPIWLEANPAGRVMLTRKDKVQNVVNLGGSKPCRYFYLGGFEITGGSTLLRLVDCQNVWIHKNKIYEGSNVGIAANSRDTKYIYITENEIFDPAKNDQNATGEGMYLGASGGKHKMVSSVIALNHVYNCKGTQGDGIELKQGSSNNWIVKNFVHDCNYPCVTVYGTGTKDRNQIEGNVLLRSNDNVLQVQGDANILHNICIQGKGAAFSSQDHDGKTQSLAVYNNTFVNNDLAVKLGGWDNRKDLKFFNNVVVSEKDTAVELRTKKGVYFMNNFSFGKNPFSAEVKSLPNGLQEFNDVKWDGSSFDVRLRNGKLRDVVGAQVNQTCVKDVAAAKK